MSEEKTARPHRILQWEDATTATDVESGCILPSQYGQGYAILGRGADRKKEWVVLCELSAYEQQEQMHYEGVVTCDISVRSRNQDGTDAHAYRILGIRSFVSREEADHLLKQRLDTETKRRIDGEVTRLVHELRSLDDREVSTRSVLQRIQASLDWRVMAGGKIILRVRGRSESIPRLMAEVHGRIGHLPTGRRFERRGDEEFRRIERMELQHRREGARERRCGAGVPDVCETESRAGLTCRFGCVSREGRQEE